MVAWGGGDGVLLRAVFFQESRSIVSVTIVSSYMPAERPSRWLRGNLHAHTTNSDGSQAPQLVIDGYAARAYDFLMLSDHDVFTDPDVLDSRGMVLLPGVEVTARGPHILHVNARTAVEPHRDRQHVLDAVDTMESFAVVAHPNWETHFNHCPQALLETWTGYLGIEIYNGVVQRLEGSPLATDRWDQLLGSGRRVWGFAHDDSHCPADMGRAWIVAQCEHPTAPDILKALGEGRFYASTGVAIDAIRTTARRIEVHAPDAQYVVAYSDFGAMVAEVFGDELGVTVPEDFAGTYVRVECHGAGRAVAWTQPFFVER